MVAVAVNPWKEVDDDVDRERDVPLASGIVQAVAKVTEGGEAAAGFDETLDDFGGFRGLSGIPVVSDGFGDASELDDGEFGGEPALEDVDATADLGKGHGSTSDGGFFTWIKGINGMERIGCEVGIAAILAETRSFPLISVHLSRGWSGLWGRMGAARAVLGAILVVLAGR